jgi:hypothetical protein
LETPVLDKLCKKYFIDGTGFTEESLKAVKECHSKPGESYCQVMPRKFNGYLMLNC